MSEPRSRTTLIAILVGLAVLAWFPRSVEVLKRPYARDGEAWFSADPDGLYHARRVERALREGRVAETDPRMNFPHGARIPWPPYYDAVLATALAPFVPDAEPARSAWIERTTASAPRIFGVLTVLIAALAAWELAGAGAALVAGATVALCRGSINYSVIGTGDHHAWISLLAVVSLWALSRAVRTHALRSVRISLAWGALLGVVCGALIGSWVAAIVNVLFLQIALGWMLSRRAREPLPGVAVLGFTLHAVAALTLAPAVLASPWRAEFPWMAVNLSWFHIAQLALGAVVFVPLLLRGERELAPGTRAARLYPAAVALGLLALAGLLWVLDLAPARGLREGFEWVSRVNTFMDTVLESRALIGPGAESGVLFLALGYGVVVLPGALAIAAWRAWRARDDALVPWVVAALVLLPMALTQRRFSDALAAPMGVTLGVAALHFVPRRWHAVGAGLAFVLASAAQFPSARSAWRSLSAGRGEHIGGPTDGAVAEREAMAWIASHTDGSDAWSVLAHWDRGHTIEWAARAPSVATNFGSYIGIESYRDPPTFFLSERPSQAREVLERRKVRFVYAPTRLITVVASMCRVAAPELRDQFMRVLPNGRPAATERWYGTMAARLLFGGVPVAPSGAKVGVETEPLGDLRLVFVTKQREPEFPEPMTGLPMPAAFVWERVPGALVETHGAAGELLDLEFDVDFPASRYRVAWRAQATLDAQGLARVCVPYATDARNGEGQVTHARWSCGTRSGALTVPESAVRTGSTVVLR